MGAKKTDLVLGGAAVAVGVLFAVAAASSSVMILGGVVAVAALMAFLAVPRRHVLSAYPVLAVAALVFLPSSEFAGFPQGGLYPVVLCLAIQAAALMRSERKLGIPPGFRWLTAYFVVLLIPSVLRDEPDVFYMGIGVVAVLQYLLVWNADSVQRKNVRNAVILIAVTQAMLGVFEARTGSGPLLGNPIVTDAGNPYLAGTLRAQGTLGHPLALSVLLIVGLALLLAAKDLRMRWRSLASVALLAGCFYTGSTTAFALVAVIAVGAFVIRRSFVGAIFASYVLGVAAFAAIGYGLVPDVLTSDLSLEENSHRTNSILAIPNLITQRDALSAIWGDGIGSTRELYQRGILIDDGFYSIDNQFTTALATAGLVGAACLVAFFIVVIARSDGVRWKAAIASFALIGMSFDFLAWYSAAVVFVTVAALAQPRPDESLPDTAHQAGSLELER